MTDTIAEGASVPQDRSKSGATRARGESAEEHKANIFVRMWVFFTQVIAELKKVVYPSAEETRTYFAVVVVFVAAIMIFTGVLDFAFAKLSALIFG